ncbi:hypothetical protein [Reichenbachiella ulvae]|nr:hypothetical protein [Reichenbachiella ulvae]
MPRTATNTLQDKGQDPKVFDKIFKDINDKANQEVTPVQMYEK